MTSLAPHFFGHLGLATLLVEEDGNGIVEANPAAGRLLGLAPSALYTRGLEGLCAPGELERLRRLLRRNREGSLTLHLLRRAESSAFRAEVQVVPWDGLSFKGHVLFVREAQRAPAKRLEPQQAALAKDLRRGLDRGEFTLHYQPIYELRTGRIHGAEALLRWPRPDGTTVQPDAFIPAAEETRLILPLGEWVLQEGCRQARRWQSRGLKLSINLSPLQLHQASLVKTVDRALHDAGAAPTSLDLEITETLAMQDPRRTLKVLTQLTKRGISVSLDDFGKGYSSLNHLKQFPVSTLKVDASFVRDMLGEPKDAAIVRSIILLGHSLGMRVLAEGVETDAEAAFLRSKNCDLVQGFLYSRPVPAAEFDHFLQGPAPAAELGAALQGSPS